MILISYYINKQKSGYPSKWRQPDAKLVLRVNTPSNTSFTVLVSPPIHASFQNVSITFASVSAYFLQHFHKIRPIRTFSYFGDWYSVYRPVYQLTICKN